MKRVMMQTYVSDATAAIELYKRAFGAKLIDMHHTPEGKVFHSELEIEGQILAVADRDDTDGIDDITGNIMQFCLHYEEGKDAVVKQAYETLLEGATVRVPLGPCVYSPCMADIVDRFGVRWCIFTA